ncbi:hypothetical protein BDB01DRAFT_398470 [Pilobolus umbonatus]|nr:hypothetical protein BDB01DRAFT_398470 [Pilobolus umbonatus]
MSHSYNIRRCMRTGDLQQQQTPEIVNNILKGSIRCLNNDQFIKDKDRSLFELIEIFEDLEHKDNNNDVIKSLLEGWVYFSTRCDLIRGLYRYNELIYMDIVDYILQCSPKLKTRFSIQLKDMIYLLVEENPDYACMIRHKLVQMQLLPDMVAKLTVAYCRDEVVFLNGLFYNSPKWFTAQSVNSGQYFIQMKNRMISKMHQYSADIDNHSVELACTIRALTGVVGYFGIKLGETETDLCLDLLRTTTSERLVKLLLCLVLIAADQFLKKQNILTKVIHLLLQSGVSEMPLVMMVYFQMDEIDQVENNIRSVLNMQIPIHKLGLFEIQRLFRSIKTTHLSTPM